MRRDPWRELFRAGMDMATAAARSARARYNDEDARQKSIDAASEFGRIVAEMDHCYRGVRVGFCTACGQLRRMSEPRRWEPEIVDLGGPEWTQECLCCRSTIEVREPSHPRPSTERRTLGQGEEGAGVSSDEATAEPHPAQGSRRPSAHRATKNSDRGATPTGVGDDAARMRHAVTTNEV